MASNVRKLMVEVLGDASGAQKAMRSVEDSSQSLGDNMKRLGRGIAGAFATQQIASFAKDAVGAAMEDAKAQQLLAQQLKASTGATNSQVAAVEEFITKTQNSTGILDDQLRPALATFVRFTGDATKAQDLLTLAMDISTGTGKDLGTVSTALARAYAGNTGALARLGIQTKDASGKALQFDEIQKELAKTFGGQTAAAAETAAGKMAIARANFETMKEEVGTALIPVLGTLVDTLMPVVQLFNGLPDGIQQVIVVTTLATAGFIAARNAMIGLGIAGKTATTSLGAIGLALGAVAVVAKIFQASSESNTEEVQTFTDALKENDKALRANAVRKLAEDDPKVRTYLETMGQLGLTIDDLAEYMRTGEGAFKFFNQTVSNLGTEIATNTSVGLYRLGAEMGVFLDTAHMTDQQVQTLRSNVHNLNFVTHNAWLEFNDMSTATDATASALIGVAIEGDDAADAIDGVTGAAFALTEQWKQTLGYFDQKQAWNNITDALGELAAANEKAFGEPSQENLRAQEERGGKVYDMMGTYIEAVGDIPEEKQTEILTQLNQGDYFAAIGLLDELTKQRVIPIRLGDLDIETRRALNFRANGGPVTSGVPYVVGERGPELFVPSSSGTIVPRIPATIGAGGGGNSYSITVNTSGVGDMSNVGAQVVDAIRAYERRNGTGWRR